MYLSRSKALSSGKVATISHIEYQIQIARAQIRQEPSFHAPWLLRGCVANSRRGASPFVRLEEERWKVSHPSPWCSPSKLSLSRAEAYCHLYGAQSYG
ncbi:hypothetical protein TNCV_3628031 [Trichonephila clavipes]|nr:hypothetical protein TNCV_3628031 [Trichonephila clavipes]